MKNKLKPCPFCGKPVNVFYSSATKGYYVVHVDEQHSDCMVQMPLSINHKRILLNLAVAYASWNERAEYADGKEHIDE